jgi:hypothetical protein
LGHRPNLAFFDAERIFQRNRLGNRKWLAAGRVLALAQWENQMKSACRAIFVVNHFMRRKYYKRGAKKLKRLSGNQMVSVDSYICRKQILSFFEIAC